MRVKGKSAIVTGAARGIGRAVAMTLAENGADVLVNTRSEETLEAVYRDVQRVAKGKVARFLADVSCEDQVNAMFDHALASFGKVDILVNNAAIAPTRPALEYTGEFFDENIRVNLYSVYYTCMRAVREMIRLRVPGSIVNFSSIGARQPHRQMLGYDTAKGATESLTRALALEVAPWDITVNAVAPASILGFYVKELDPETVRERDPRKFATPIPRQGIPQDVANLVLFLASPEASYITGQVIAIDGGLSAQARPAVLSPLRITPGNIGEFDI